MNVHCVKVFWYLVIPDQHAAREIQPKVTGHKSVLRAEQNLRNVGHNFAVVNKKQKSNSEEDDFSSGKEKRGKKKHRYPTGLSNLKA